MTTILLAKKLLSLKANKIGLEKIQFLKKRNKREMAETKKSLQKLITKYRVRNSCRLCLRPAETNLFINKAGINFAEDVKNILSIEVKKNDGKPQYICPECATTLRKAVELKQVAEVAQWRLQQEAELETEIAFDDVDDGTNNDNEEIIIYHVNAPKCEQCQKVPNASNDCERCQEDAKKPRQGTYVCETCGLELKTMTRLKTHMKTHTDEFDFSCGYCPYRARSSTSLRIHERSHTGDRPYRCVQCHSTFSSASNLASHRRSHLPPAYKCDICQRGFKFRQAVHNHIATQHRSAKPFYCGDCGNSFATRKMLRRHERKAHNRPKMRQGPTPSYIKSQQHIDEESDNES
ncbi:zinc finger protein Paris-like isoform X2 [Maniola hyperantus]|uniref:zinc finger protein Paris-like isoform X2 n=1 Tax=Aphantopus hyperantus TaxID=2795564 RepID=UPI003748285D